MHMSWGRSAVWKLTLLATIVKLSSNSRNVSIVSRGSLAEACKPETAARESLLRVWPCPAGTALKHLWALALAVFEGGNMCSRCTTARVRETPGRHCAALELTAASAGTAASGALLAFTAACKTSRRQSEEVKHSLWPSFGR